MEQANFATQTLKDTKTTVCHHIFNYSIMVFFVSLYLHIYIYIYIERERERELFRLLPNLQQLNKIMENLKSINVKTA